MKKTSLSMRILAMALVLIMTVQIIPANVFAFGELQATNTGINLSTVNQEDAINWPIKIYDYLDDGMLFEWNDSTHTGSLAVGNNSTTGSVVPYGGGAHPVVTKKGTDYTYNGAVTATDGNVYTDSIVTATDFKDPRHLHIAGKGDTYTANANYNVFSFSSANQADMRYVVMVYRASGISKKDFSIVTGPSWARTETGHYLSDSSTWTYIVIDLDEWFAGGANSFSAQTEMRICFGFYAGKRGLPSGSWIDISHFATFTNAAEAENYGIAAAKFSNDPGEYLKKTTESFTATTTTVKYPDRPMYGDTTNEYVFSLNQYWNKTDTANGPALDPSADGTNTYPNASYPYAYYGMDLTRTNTDKGTYTNAYTSHSYWTWASGTTQYYKFTNNGVTTTNTFVMDAIGVKQRQEKNGATYVRLTTSGPSRILLSKFREDRAVDDASAFKVPQTAQVNYLVLVYRGNNLTADDQYGVWAQGYDNASRSGQSGSIVGNWKYAGLADSATWTTAKNVNPQYFNTNSGWQYLVVDMNEVIGAKDSNMPETNRLARAGLYLPELSDGKSIDLAYVGYFPSQEAADAFGVKAQTYMNADPTPVTTTTKNKTWGNSRVWNTGNNKGFGLLYSTGGGNWPVTNTTNKIHAIAGGSNSTDAYGYNTWMIGYPTNQLSNTDYATNRRDPMTGEKYTGFYTTTSTKAIQTIDEEKTTTNKIYFLSAGYSNDGDGNGVNGFDTKVLDFDGYQLLERVTSGIMTAGLLEGSLRTVRVDNVEYRVPVYRQETVEYIAYLLAHALVIPKRDANGSYNSNFITGGKSTQFGGVDLNGDGVVGMCNLDGDSRTGTNGNECDETKVDLATALRHCLGITLPIGKNVGTYATDYETTLGTYAETVKKDQMLIGKFEDCRYSIKTAMDAAYYMLNSLFIANSWNQKQNDYYYLNMPMAEVTTNNHSGDAYVFDAGFTTGKTATAGTAFTDDGTNKSAIRYSPVVSADGKTAGTGTISMALDENNKTLVTGKTHFNFDIDEGEYSWTTRFPFLPVTNAKGDYAGQTYSYYFWDDDVRTYYPDTNSYINRNYNYVMASNGEFVYKENDNLFFEFEGDDDVYLFINGELVLDIGAAHSITSVYIDVNDYVDEAREQMKALAKYGYTSDMTAEEFDDLIDAAYLDEYIYDETTGKITGTQSVKNPYTADQIRELKRWARLDLVDGQICQFDFYYMERHGWGANMRIVTNMHITDPSLDVDKTAYQYGKEIEFGGVIDPTASLEYNFSLTNNGNQKLYNLTFKDEVIGLTLDPDNGLTFIKDANGNDKNGIYILDSLGKTLEAMDLTALVAGYNALGQYVEVPVTFPEVNGDGGQTALKNFLKSLQAEGTESDYDDAEVTHAGSGLWVDGTVIIKGIHYMLTPEQMKAGQVLNTVNLTATTRINPATVGSQTLSSDAEHLIYTSGFPVHYQWAGHNIFIKMEHLLEKAKKEAETEGTQLNLYNKFFSSVDSLDDIHYNLCDKYGRTDGYYAYHTKTSDKVGNPGYLVNYDEPGIYTFYLLLYMQEGASKQYSPTGVDAEDVDAGEYAIIRTQVYVADVEDSVYVLDYGLSTESLDLGGELFKNDHLFGPYGTIRAKLMGVTGTEPSYLDPAETAGVNLDPEVTNDTDYCRIAFQSQNLSASNTITTPDGTYMVNLAIPGSGKLIGYDSTTGEYTLTGVGTMTVKVNLPTVPVGTTDPWATPYLYYWYDDGTTGPTWPGTPLKSLGAGQFEVDIPADVTNVIVNNGSAALKTNDLKITPGLENTITVTVSNTNVVSAEIATDMEEITMHVMVPSDWGDVYLYHWGDSAPSDEFPGEQLTETDSDGYYTIKVNGDVANLVINNGNKGKQTNDLHVYAGKEVWIDVSSTVTGTATDDAGNVTTTYYGASVKYTQEEGFKVHATVPASWGDTVYLYYWRTDGSKNAEFPGEALTKGDLWYNYKDADGKDMLIPYDVSNIIISDGKHQTVDLTITPGLETWISVNNETTPVKDGNGNIVRRYTADIAYGAEGSSTGLTFTPKDFLDQANNMWLAITVHGTNASPSALNSKIDIHSETQMYKKITVLPATVVYYEDTFDALEYNQDAVTENTFTHHGNGSGRLSQSIDPDQPYGQDAAYQGGENDLYSGDSLTEVTIQDYSWTEENITDEFLVSTFDFKGTGFEIIGRTTAFDSGSFMARVYKKADYSDTAYDEYMEDAQEYLTEMTNYLNVYSTHSDATTAWKVAVAKYNEAQTAYNAAKAAHDAAVAKTDDALNQAYVAAYKKAYAAFESYEKARSDYNKALTSYETALKTYTGRTDAFAVCSEKGGCSYSYSEELAAFTTSLVLGNQPTAAVAPETLATMTKPTAPESPFVTATMVFTQFDHGNNGGAEGLNQVPVIRVNGLDLGEYVIEVAAMPSYIYDAQYNITGVQPTSLYIDGVRIYQPMGPTNDAYSDKENNATVNELRDLLATGKVGVGIVGKDGLSVTTGTTTWTESLHDNDFDASNKETYNSIKVGSTADYLIQGPNNEVYMEGNATNSALIFYVKETAGATVHELQIAARALDYGRYYGAGSTGLNVQLQYGVLDGSNYAWKNLVQVVSATEQYYTIPYAECPVDTQGRYQIVLRAINPLTQSSAMVSYTNLKLNGLSIEEVDGIGEGSIVFYQNGILVKPEYELVIIKDDSFEEKQVIPFYDGSELTMALESDVTKVYVRVTFNGKEYNYCATSDLGTVTSATLQQYVEGSDRWALSVPKGNGEVTFKVRQTSLDSLQLSYCLHTYGEGVRTREPNCSLTGITAYTCSKCDHIKYEHSATNNKHHYSGAICYYCGAQEPKFYLVGFINEADYGCGKDAQNMGDYLFVDGKVTVEFEEDSYVYLKADGNKTWYMLPSYSTKDTATFYDTTTSGNTEKMFAPCGVKLIFTLTINDDGSLTLHYEEPCQHTWDDGKVAIAATCTTDGEKIFTCSKCYQTKSGLIPATGHNYVNGVCANGCGEIEYRTIYFKNTAGWENVYLYTKSEGTEVTPWPGDLMELAEGYTDVYTATIPSYLTVQFNDGGNNQTGDMTIPDADTYNYSTKLWENLSGEVDYYLVGFINGVDYGYGDNSNNMGAYKFEDGKLIATFDKDSYVIVKTTGNANWYMTQSFCETYSATLYDSGTGANEKMYIPAGTEIEFTLTVNDDGTLDLVAHSWGSVMTGEPTCTETGEMTYTCYLCNDSYKEDIPANGHSFVDDICSVCGAENTRIVYFHNTAGWEKVYVYAYTQGTPATVFTEEWPGNEMSLVEGKTDLYYYMVPAKAKSVIFNNGSSGNGNQTQNLHNPTDENNKYTYGANVWTTLDTEVEVPKGTKLYLKPGSEWAQANAWFAAYFFNDATNQNTWIKMTDNDSDGIYECYAPEGYPNVIFVRMNPKYTAPSWNDGEKWNQTVNETIPTDGGNFFTITNPWDGQDGKGEGTWSTFTCSHEYSEVIITAAGCETVGEKMLTCDLCGDSYNEEIPATGHSYTEEITKAATCTEAGVKTLTCTCGDSYTEEIAALNHNYVDGTCSNCGGSESGEPVQADKVYLLPNSNWTQASARFVSYFYNNTTGLNTWIDMTDSDGDGYYECEVPSGYPGVIFCRMNPETDENNWNEGVLWNQTNDLTVPIDDKVCYTVADGAWSKGDGSWGAYAPECEHDYSEQTTTEATCTEAGVKTFTCSKCSTSYTEEIAATGHTYVDGTCSVCGEAEVEVQYITVYFRNNWGWTNIYAYVWTADGELAGWPGTAATYYDTDGTYEIYSATIPDGASVIFNGTKSDGSGATDKTPDIIDAYDGACYSMVWDGDNNKNAVEVDSIDNVMNSTECEHDYTEEITTAATCTTAGVKTYTCSKCTDSYTEEIAATGEHTYVNGTCSCGATKPTETVTLYLLPNSNWNIDSARFAAYFFNNTTGLNTWIDMTDSDGDGYYECEVPSGYPGVIFCRMNPETDENNWNEGVLWNQTNDLTVPTDDKVCYTVADGAWSKGDGSWGTYTAPASLSLRSAKFASYISGDEDTALNLYAINAQMNSDLVYGVLDEVEFENEAVKELDIKTASLVLTDDIIMDYNVIVPENAENVYMTFHFNGKTTTVTDYTIDANGRYCFSFLGINAKLMGENICATAYATVNGVQLTDCVEEFSVRTYCVKQLNKYPDDAELVRLISDLLVYGAKDQLYSGYKTDELVTDGLDLSPSTFTGLDQSYNKLEVRGESDKDVRYSAVTLILDNKVIICLTVKTDNPSAYTYTVSACGKDTVYTAEDLVKAGDGKYYLYFDGLKAADFNETVTATIQKDGENISQMVTYSVNSYVYKNQNANNEVLRELVQAIYNYGKSAYEYFN